MTRIALTPEEMKIIMAAELKKTGYMKMTKTVETKEEMLDSIVRHIRAEYGKDLDLVTEHEFWTALSRSVMERLAENWEKTRKLYGQVRQTHYFSAEFLIGRSLVNNLINLGIYEETAALCKELGYDLDHLEEEETDPGLGNGGLGRLAACFLDSCASLNYPVTGYGILYRYGLFKQKIEDGFQREYPDPWMELPYPFNCRREDEKVLVRYADLDVWAIPYDLPVTGYATDNINVLRLWRPEPAEDFDFNLFNSQRFDDAVIERNRVQDIYRVLYPNDTSYDGKVLRVRQQYFFTSASLQSILKNFVDKHGREKLGEFSRYHVLHLNDTHPVLAIPELIRLLTERYGLSFEAAWKICRESFAYTNHTTLAEALENWDIGIFQFLFPDILEIIRKIDTRFRREAREKGLNNDEIEKHAPIHNGHVHMAWLACYTAFSINGVAEIHTGILKSDTLNTFYKLWPERFQNKTNGVTPRRWLRVCNQELSDLISELSGSEAWLKDLSRLEELEVYADDSSLQEKLIDIKRRNKERLSHYVAVKQNISLNPSYLYDVQVKRLHEYKRQLLNALEIIDRWYRLHDNPSAYQQPVSYIFAAKAAPGYFRAKSVIKFINEIAAKINRDPLCAGKMEVNFLPNYNVSLGEKIFPAADLSEQISTVGKEASGTGNMKFMMNGAMTLGTWDGANLEICEAVGEENCFMFGAKLEDFPPTLSYYNSRWHYEHIPGLKRAVDSLVDGTFDDGGSGMFQDLYNSLLQGSSSEKADPYYVLGDFDAYRSRRQEAFTAYADQASWARMAWINICNSGRFSSDRSINDYAENIWRIEKAPVR